MKIYFVASPTVVTKNVVLFKRIYQILAKRDKMVDNSVLKWAEEGFCNSSPGYMSAVEKVKKVDVVVAEVSGHSMSMGFIVGKALELNKPVVALYKKGEQKQFLKWMKNKKLVLAPYDTKDLSSVLDESLKKSEKLMDVRFNFFVSPGILAYLDWVANKRMIPRSVFLRRLIEKEMKKDKEYASGV
jgi:hypothetical protein